MGEEVTVTEANANALFHRRHHNNRENRGSHDDDDDDDGDGDDVRRVLPLEVDIYPLSCYYFGSKDAIPFKDHSFPDRLQRIKSKFVFFSFLSFFLFSLQFYFHRFSFC